MAERQPVEKMYFCRNCSTEKKSSHVPAAWFSLARYAQDVDENGKRRVVGLGLFCTVVCLAAQVERMTGTGSKP